MELFDLATYIVGYVSPRTNGNLSGDFSIAGPSWRGAVPGRHRGHLPGADGARVRPRRTQLFDADDLPNGTGSRTATASSLCRPTRASASTAAEPFVDDVPPSRCAQGRALGRRSSQVLNAMLRYMPPLRGRDRASGSLRTRLGLAGDLPRERGDRRRGAGGHVIGLNEMYARAGRIRSSAELFGSREHLGDDYLARACGALLGIFGNAQEEYLGVGWQTDASGDGVQRQAGAIKIRSGSRQVCRRLPPSGRSRSTPPRSSCTRTSSTAM